MLEGGDITVDEDNSGNFTADSTDPNSKALTFEVSNNPLHGSVSVVDNVFTYTPNANYNGTDSFEIVSKNDICSSLPSVVNVVVNAVNDPLTVDSFTVDTDKNIEVAVELSGVDVDGEAFDYGIVDNPINGTLTGTASSLLYTPNLDFVGQDSFTYMITNATEESSLGTVTINVNEVTE